MKKFIIYFISFVRSFSVWFLICFLYLVYSAINFARLPVECSIHFNCSSCHDFWMGFFCFGSTLFQVIYFLIKKLFGQKIKNWLFPDEDPAHERSEEGFGEKLN